MARVPGRRAVFCVPLLLDASFAFRQGAPKEFQIRQNGSQEAPVDDMGGNISSISHPIALEEGNLTQHHVMPEEHNSTLEQAPAQTSLLDATSASLLATEHLLSAKVGKDFLTRLIEEPEFLLLVIYLAVGAWGAFKVWLQYSSDNKEASQEVRAQRDALQATYMSSVKEIEGILVGMSESSATLAEWNFEEKRQKFEKFVERVRDKPDNFIESREVAVAILDPFRTFLSLWLSIYEQCTLDPINKPKVIVPEKELRKCRSVVDMAGLVADRLGKNSVTFIKAWVTKVREQEYSVDPDDFKETCWYEFGKFGFGMQRGHAAAKKQDDEPDVSDSEEVESTGSNVPASQYPIDVKLGFVRMSVLSQTHAILLIAFGLGLFALTAQLVLAHVPGTIVVLLAQGGLGVILLQIQDIEEIARLQAEILRLELLSEEVKRNHDQLNEFYGKLTKLSHLWRYRTLPCLEHFNELHMALLNMQGADKVAFLQAINDTWTPKMEGLGDVEDWMGENSIPEEFLKLASTQLTQTTEYVAKHRVDEMSSSLVLQRVDQTFGFLVVRVLASFNLTNKGPLGQMSNPYVSISVDQKGGKAMWKTKSVSADLNPRWGEEYFIPIAWSAKLLELHVKDDQRAGHEEDNTSLGYLNVMFRDMEPGTWVKRKENLWSERKQTQKKSELMYEVFFANEVRQLRDLDAP